MSGNFVFFPALSSLSPFFPNLCRSFRKFSAISSPFPLFPDLSSYLFIFPDISSLSPLFLTVFNFFSPFPLFPHFYCYSPSRRSLTLFAISTYFFAIPSQSPPM